MSSRKKIATNGMIWERISPCDWKIQENFETQDLRDEKEWTHLSDSDWFWVISPEISNDWLQKSCRPQRKLQSVTFLWTVLPTTLKRRDHSNIPQGLMLCYEISLLKHITFMEK